MPAVGDDGVDLADRSLEIGNGPRPFRRNPREAEKLPLLQDGEAIVDNLEAQLHLGQGRRCASAIQLKQGILQPLELDHRLARGEGHVVAEKILQRMLALADDGGRVKPGGHEDRDHHAQEELHQLRRSHARVKVEAMIAPSPVLRPLKIPLHPGMRT